VKKGERYVPTWYLKIPYRVLNTMICRLYGEESSTHFRMEWFPMAYKISQNGHVFNWETILSFSIAQVQPRSQEHEESWFLHVGISNDVVCIANSFPFSTGLGLRQGPNSLLLFSIVGGKL
jgi:hypothetical protein